MKCRAIVIASALLAVCPSTTLASSQCTTSLRKLLGITVYEDVVEQAIILAEVNHPIGFGVSAEFAADDGMLDRGLAMELQADPNSALPKLEAWARRRVDESLKEWAANREKRWLPNPSSRILTLMMLFHGEADNRLDELAFHATLQDNVALLSPGHGLPGGKEFSADVLVRSGTPIEGASNQVTLKLDGDLLMKFFAQKPEVRCSRVVFLQTCNGGLARLDKDNKVVETAPAARLAKFTGKPVIAALGNLSTNQLDGKMLVSVRNAGNNEVLDKDKAFMLFSPEKEPELIPFGKVLSLAFKEGGGVEYRGPSASR